MNARAVVVVLLALLLVAAAVAGYHAAPWRLPDRWNPFAPLRIDEPPGWLTRLKLARLSKEPESCLAVLATSRLRVQRVPDRRGAPGCELSNAVRVDRLQAALGAPLVLSCPAAVSLALWERHTLQPEAQRRFGEPVARIEHLGSYACRNVYGRETGPRSRHATADALDVAGVVLRSGRRISVLRDWRGDGDSADFLRALRSGACAFFDAVLSPDYNDEHADHLHLDRGPYRTCR